MSTFFDYKPSKTNVARVEWAGIDTNVIGRFADFVGFNFIKDEIKNAPIDRFSYSKSHTVDPTQTITLLLPKNTIKEDVDNVMAEIHNASPTSNYLLPNDIQAEDYLVLSYKLPISTIS